MPSCKFIKKKNRKICLGDLRDEIIIQSRAITPPVAGAVDFSESFSAEATVWAMINTVNGETIFDATNVERDVTHNVYARFLNGVTAEDWILFKNDRLVILNVENLEERSDFMLMKCSNRGTTDNKANQL